MGIYKVIIFTHTPSFCLSTFAKLPSQYIQAINKKLERNC
ncbi:hypothetical protein PFLA_b0804 [Pseudoalteromonas flavipulchra NCIMB 2033 = ATCC BAA-314]|nr:hypothetical protein [Pseudoalteromonas flavipulchra NCIMB 2033 = ATCC BAA-314]